MSRHDVDNADDHTTDLLKQALNEEAAMVDPSPGGLQQIQARTAEADGASSSRRRRWMLVTPLGAGLAAAAVIFGVVILNGGSNNGTDGTHAVSTPQQHRGVYDPNAPASEQFTMFYVDSQPENGRLAPRIYTETHTVTDPGDDRQLAAINEYLTSSPIDPDYSRWPEGTAITAASIDHTSATTTLNLVGSADLDTTSQEFGPPGVGVTDRAYLNALFLTLGADNQVDVTYNGQPADALHDERIGGATAPDFNDVRAWITIDNIVDGQTVSSPVTVQVSGNTFEGNIVWQLLDGSGSKVDEGYTTTSQGMWTQVPVDLGTLDPGTYTFKAFELSAKDGSVMNLDDKTFTVE